MSDTAELIRQGNLDGALAVLTADVKARPSDAARRFELAELLLVMGDLARADTQLDLVSTQDTSFGLLTSLLRQLIRAETARQEVFTQGRTPEMIGDAGPEIAAGLKLLMELRQGGDAGAHSLDIEPEQAGAVDEQPFVGVRDMDDRVAHVLEVLTSTGKYYWIPWRDVRALQMRPPERLRDLVWRAADLDVADGPSGVVYIPCTYVAPAAEQTPTTRLGRETQWLDDSGVVRGVGLRCFLLGDAMAAMSEVSDIIFDPSAAR